MIHNIWKVGYSLKVDLSKSVNLPSGQTSRPFLWQQEFEKLANERLVSLTASTGAGKSRAIKLSSVRWTKDPKNKTVIVVPRLGIGQEFDREVIELKNRSKLTFEAINLCSQNEDLVNDLVSFIENKSDRLPPALRTVVCCVPTLVLAFERAKSFRNIKLVIDEAHHCSTAEDEEGELNSNRLGEVFVSALKKKTNSILLVTATHFRADRRTIIPSRYDKQFKVFEVPFYRVQEECRQFNKEISAGYAFYEKNGAEGIGKAFNPNEKTIIFAHRGSAAGTEKKKEQYIRDCLKEMGCDIIDDQNGCLIVKRGRKKLVVADLITQKRAKKAAEVIKVESKEKKTFGVDIIFALEKFKEGCDYPPLQHCIIEGIRESYGDIIQMVGRVTRDYVGKKYCRFTTIIPNRLGYKEQDVEQSVQSHFNYIISCMCILDFFKPYKARMFRDRRSRDWSSSEWRSPLEELGDREAQLDFMRRAVKRFVVMAQDEQPETFKERLSLMVDIVEGIRPNLKDKKAIAQQVILEMAATLKIRQGADISEVDVNLLKRVDINGFAHEFVSCFLGNREFLDFRDRAANYMGETRSLEEHVAIWREREVRSDGQWLKLRREEFRSMGYFCACWSVFGYKLSEWQKLVWGDEYRHPSSPIDLEDAKQKIREYYEKHGKRPVVSSKDFSLSDGTTAVGLNQALRRGLRGLEGGSSLSRFSHEVLNLQYAQKLTEEEIIEEIKKYHKEHGKYPTDKSKEKPSIAVSWRAIDKPLRVGKKGLKGGSSLSKLVERVSGEPSSQNQPRLSEKIIVQEIKKYYREQGGYPTKKSKKKPSLAVSWASIDSTLKGGYRGLEGSSSLSKLVERVSGEPNRFNQPNLSEEIIVQEIKKYYKKHKKYPTEPSKEKPSIAVSWMAISANLREGYRGLQGGSSLSKLVEEVSGKPNHLNQPSLSEEAIIQEIKNYYQEYKKYPTKSSKEKPFVATSWGAIDEALRDGLRGLKGGSSLSKLRKKYNLT